MLYYYDGPQRMWRKPLTALKNKNLIPTVKFWKLSVMVWGCTSSKGVGVFRILDEIMAKEVYLDIFYFILNWSPALRNLVLLTRLIRINSITNTIKTMILNINLIYVKPGYYTTVPKLLILLPKVLILTLSKICGFI